MEKAAGVPLFKIWGEIPEYQRLDLIKALTILEFQLSSIQLPAYGSLYLRSSCGNIQACKPLDPKADPEGSYCVGRSGDRSYVPDCSEGKDEYNLDLGPCKLIQLSYCSRF